MMGKNTKPDGNTINTPAERRTKSTIVFALGWIKKIFANLVNMNVN